MKVVMPKLTVKTPDKSFWMAVATQFAKDVRKRTETAGLDAEGKSFGSYSSYYEKMRIKKGRGAMVNLSFTGKMLGALAKGISATANRARVTLSGSEGGKAWNLERQGRVFMEISKKNADDIIKGVANWTAQKNKLK